MVSDWQQDWQQTINVIGQDFSGGIQSTAIDEIEKSSVRRFLEAVELDCPLHYDADVARQHGYRNILAPLSGISQTWVDTGLWRPGLASRYPSNHPHVDVPREPVAEAPKPPTPPTTVGFATDIEIEYFEPPVVGDRLTVRGRKLISCTPRETRVGRGAFTVWEREVVNQDGVRVALLRNGGYAYTPFEATTPASEDRPSPARATPAHSPDDDDLIAIRNVTPATAKPVDWSKQRYYEDVNVGDELDPITVNLTIRRAW